MNLSSVIAAPTGAATSDQGTIVSAVCKKAAWKGFACRVCRDSASTKAEHKTGISYFLLQKYDFILPHRSSEQLQVESTVSASERRELLTSTEAQTCGQCKGMVRRRQQAR